MTTPMKGIFSMEILNKKKKKKNKKKNFPLQERDSSIFPMVILSKVTLSME
jgi:hypothetical protein